MRSSVVCAVRGTCPTSYNPNIYRWHMHPNPAPSRHCPKACPRPSYVVRCPPVRTMTVAVCSVMRATQPQDQAASNGSPCAGCAGVQGRQGHKLGWSSTVQPPSPPATNTHTYTRPRVGPASRDADKRTRRAIVRPTHPVPPAPTPRTRHRRRASRRPPREDLQMCPLPPKLDACSMEVADLDAKCSTEAYRMLPSFSRRPPQKMVWRPTHTGSSSMASGGPSLWAFITTASVETRRAGDAAAVGARRCAARPTWKAWQTARTADRRTKRKVAIVFLRLARSAVRVGGAGDPPVFPRLPSGISRLSGRASTAARLDARPAHTCVCSRLDAVRSWTLLPAPCVCMSLDVTDTECSNF